MPWKEHIPKKGCVLYIYILSDLVNVNLICHSSGPCRKNFLMKMISLTEHHLHCVIFLMNCSLMNYLLMKNGMKRLLL